MAVARKGALALYDARARDREIYDAKLKVLQTAAEASDPESTAATPHDQLGSFYLSETRLPEGVVDRCWVCATACVEPGLCARCIELGLPPELETTESDVDDQTSASDEEAEAVIDYRDASSEDDIVATDVPQVSANTAAAMQAVSRTLRRQQREQQTAPASNETTSSQRLHTGRGRGRGRLAV